MSGLESLERMGRGGLGPFFAAMVALLAGLPGLVALPPLDRDESRFAEASAQMLETRDFVTPRFQETPRLNKPVGVYWLQAAAVATFSHVESREIWAYRIPSLLGAMLAAAACAWGAAAFLGPGAALVAGAILGAGLLLSTEAAIAATDGVLAGAVTLAMAALGRLYLAARGGPSAGRRVKALFWVGLAASVLVKGPIGPMVAALSLITLAAWDRDVRWMRDIGWGWGLILILAMVGPWALAITIASDGAFWGASVGGDLATKLTGGQDGHGGPPGAYLFALPFMIFPATLLLPAGLLTGWQARNEPAVRFALAWLIPAWFVFEATPTKLLHYPLPLYGALAWLMARALSARRNPVALGVGAALMLVVGLAFAIVGPAAVMSLNAGAGLITALLTGALFVAAGVMGAWLLWRGEATRALLAGGALALLAHGLLLAAVLPSLRPLWLSSRASRALEAAGASPRQGVIPGPVTVAGYEEPSLVFLLGTETEFGDAQDAADAIADGRPAIVEDRLRPAFQAALAAQGVTVRRAGQGAGLDYSNGRRDVLRIFLPQGEVKR